VVENSTFRMVSVHAELQGCAEIGVWSGMRVESKLGQVVSEALTQVTHSVQPTDRRTHSHLLRRPAAVAVAALTCSEKD